MRNPEPQRGFTLLEVLLALLLMSLIGLACWRLFDSVLRSEAASRGHTQALGRLQQALAVIENDVRHGLFAPGTCASAYGVGLQAQHLYWLRAGVGNPLDAPRSDLRQVEYRVHDGTLWRHARALEHAAGQPQRLLDGVSQLRWRLYAPGAGWQLQWPLAQGAGLAPHALELLVSVGTLREVRRVMLFVQAPDEC